MSDSTAKSKVNPTVVQIIGIVLFIIVLLFQAKLGRAANENLIPPEAKSNINGIISQVQVLIAVAMVVMVPKKGYRTAIIMCIVNMLYILIFGVIIGGSRGAVPGVLMPAISIVICTLINYYSQKAVEAQEELERRNQKLTVTNDKITKEGEKLQRMVYYDALTGLCNREMFGKQVSDIIKKDKESPFTVAFINIDNFTKFNSDYTDEVGDVILTTFGYRLHNLCGSAGVVGRVDGDEFAVVIKGPRTKEAVASFLSDLRAELCEPVAISEKLVELTVCIGVAQYPRNGSTSLELMGNAQDAVRKAKEKGEGSTHFYSE